MKKRHHKQGIQRGQGYLLPPSIEEYVGEDNPVRAIDSYVESLDVEKLGFKKAGGELKAGQPAYHPKMLLKLYLYGYLNRVRSSRRLAIECQRNLEVIWLVEGQKPSHQTIADFRADNLGALKQVTKDFVQVCKELDLFGAELVAIDGTFLRGNVGKDSIYTTDRLKRALVHLEADIAAYLQELAQADQQEGGSQAKADDLPKKLARLQALQAKRKEQLEQLASSGETQIAEVDEDARLLNKGGGTVAGYNVQAAVDSKHSLIVVAEAVQDGNDLQQLAPMSQAAKAELGVEQLVTTQDMGYFNVQQIQECEQQGITPYVPEPDRQAPARQTGRFTRAVFSYDAQADVYHCPQGQELKFSTTQHKGEKAMHLYRSSVPVCATCPVKAQCLPKKTACRTISRWEHESLIEAHRERMAKEGPEKMRQRAAIVEHVFGTLKQWCGWTHFLLRGLEKVRAELSLLMLAYNFKRVLTIVGLAAFRAYCLTRQIQKAGGCA
jgi:transposase